MARFPSLETDDDLIADRRGGLRLPVPRRAHINVVHDPWIIRDDVIKIPRMLQRPDNSIACALQNPDHSSFASSFRALVGQIAGDPSHHAIAVHGRPGIFCCNENVRLARFFARKKTVAGSMNRQFAGYQIRLGRQ